jgi:DNA-binding SARP family transcriptional activator
VAEFRLLGSVEWHVAGRAMELGPARQRKVLAALLADAGQRVAIETLIDRVWDDAPPAKARDVLYAYMTRIRRVLAQPGGAPQTPPDLLIRRAGGYVLDVDRDRVDLYRFRRLVEHGRAAGSDERRRVEALREALDLWRGPALADLSGAWVTRMREGLSQLRLDAVILWAHAELRVGNGAAVVGPVTDLIAEHPLAEPLVAMLMRALSTIGRSADALDCYARARLRLIEQLGVDPGPDLRQLHQALLRGDDVDQPAVSAATVAARHSPAQLPLDMRSFTGRGAELAELDKILAAAGEQPTAVVISALSGTAGVGKTALAVHWAHRVAGQFPDGQMYVNLRGFDPTGSVVSPAEAVRGFLDALGVSPQRLPHDLPAQVGLYRSLLAGRRMLVVLDNAYDAEQVRPLLPGAPGSLVVVTSRCELSGLVAAEGAYPLTLDLLSAVEARQLLTRRLGADRIAGEPAAVDEIIALCARLPLALAIVAARAAARPGFPLAALASQLCAARGRLDAFADGDSATDVRAVFSWSYDTLGADAARLFRLLGLHPGPDIAPPAAASLAGLPPRQVGRLLAELSRAHLIAERTPGRYVFHDLLRAYAAELVRTVDTGAERRAALHRMLDHYLRTAHRADRLLYPFRDPIALPPHQEGTAAAEDLTDHGQALEWFTAEHPVLLATIELAASSGFDAHTWKLAWTLTTFFDRRGHWRDQAATQQTALQAALRTADRSGQAHAHRGLALACAQLGSTDDAIAHLRCTLDLLDETGDHTGQADTHLTLGWVLERQDRRPGALRHAEHALELFRAAGHKAGQARALNAIGWHHAQLGDHEEAVTRCQQALTLLGQLGDRRGAAAPWDSLGYAHHQLGHYPQAITCYQHALDLFREVGDRYNEGDVLIHLGDTHHAAGHIDAARDAWLQALDVLDALDRPDTDDVRTRLSRVDQPCPEPA